jgi:hypothetical protein
MDKPNILIDNLSNEKSISQYKIFYKEHLLLLKHRQIILDELYPIYTKFENLPPKGVLKVDKVNADLEDTTDKFLSKYFSKELIALYNKPIPKPTIENKYSNEDNILRIMFIGTLQSVEASNEKYKQEWSYKTNFLRFLYKCLYYHGLHQNIMKRNPIIDKKFNLVVHHSYRSDTKQTDFKIMMDYKQFDNQFVSLYQNQKSIKMGGKLIPFDSIHEVKITTTLLKEDEIVLFASKNNFIWNSTQKDALAFIENCTDETEKYHPNPFDERIDHKGLNIVLIEETKQWLISYPGSFKLYSDAIQKFNKDGFERNLLDDLRLSLELLLKELLNNNKSLENQLPAIGKYQKERGSSTETTNMFSIILDRYAKYQNSHVKHNDKVPKNEIELIIELTTSFIKYLIKK